jgi:hypothetical protein
VTLEDYINELKNDALINELNLKEKSLELPGIKAKWVSRLINHKNSLNNLEFAKRKIIRDLIPVVRESLPVKLSDATIKEKAEETKEVMEITTKINAEKKIIEFLEKTEKIVSSFTFDVGNIIKIIQLETL